MDLQTSFGVLSEVIERYESRGRSVRDVEASAADGVLHAELEIPLSLCSSERGPTLAPETATLTDDGGLQVEFAPPGLPEPPLDVASLVSVERRGIDVDGDRPVLSVVLAIEPMGSRDAADTARPHSDADTEAPASADEEQTAAQPESGLAAVRDDSVPPYEDTPYLERLYETCETFAEMSQRIEMEVSSETVRRYMIEADIHDPTPYDTSTTEDETDEQPTTGDGADEQPTTGDEADGNDADGATTTGADESEVATSREPTGDGSTPVESPSDEPGPALPDEQLVTDGIGLPAELRVAEVADAVLESATLYEVHQRLDIDRERTRNLLRELNLLDLVMGRLATASEQEVTEDLIATRLRECAAGD